MANPSIQQKVKLTLVTAQSPITAAKRNADRIIEAHHGHTLDLELLQIMLMKAFLAGRQSHSEDADNAAPHIHA